jgi:hypothetical protein
MRFRRWVMRSVQCIIAILLYCAAFVVYTYGMANPYYSLMWLKVFYNAFTGITLLFYFIDRSRGFESFWHKQFNAIVFFCPIINYFIIILTHLKVLADPIMIFLCSNGAIIVTSLFLLYSGGRHHEFNND